MICIIIILLTNYCVLRTKGKNLQYFLQVTCDLRVRRRAFRSPFPPSSAALSLSLFLQTVQKSNTPKNTPSSRLKHTHSHTIAETDSSYFNVSTSTATYDSTAPNVAACLYSCSTRYPHPFPPTASLPLLQFPTFYFLYSKVQAIPIIFTISSSIYSFF